MSDPRALALIGVVAACLLGAGLFLGLTGSGSGDREVDTKTLTKADPANAPASPPARICGSDELAGPDSPPSGAQSVTPSQSLTEAVHSAPPGTTFWLSAGNHLLGGGQYDQVKPKSGDSFVGAPGAVIDGQHTNAYAFTGHAQNVSIEHLTIQNFGSRGDNMNEGVVNHDGGHDWKVRHNTIRGNAGAGLFVASGNVVEHNCLSKNGQYGFSAYEGDGVRDVVLEHNEVVGNNTDDWESRRDACGCSGGGKFWDTRGAKIVDNWIHDNRSAGLWADTNNTEFLVKGNYISENDSKGFIYEISYNAAIIKNTFARNGLVDGPKDHGFATPALYLSESGSDKRAGSSYGATLEVAGNRFIDNWSGLLAWENADRFSGSPANTSSGYTTLVNPDVATLDACGDPKKIKTSPFKDDCRWKTQNLRVHDNIFRFDRGHLGAKCTAATGCGYVGLASNFGTYPDWSPYKGEVVEDQITFDQDNVWSSNRYIGPWQFMAHELGNTVSWDTWRSAPYRQDQGSSLTTSDESVKSGH